MVNLPIKDVDTVFVGIDYLNLLNAPFFKQNITNIITILPSNDLLRPIRSHPDMHLCQLNAHLVISNENEHLINKYNLNDAFVAESRFSSQYPDDIGLNALVLNKFFIHNLKYTDKKLLSFAQKEGYKLIDVKQGYTKCSTCIVDEKSAITSDKGIYNALSNEGLDVLLIKEGYINLSGMNYGFIGGATGKIGKNKLAFTGHIDTHPDKDKILNFIKEKNITPVFLTDNQIFDVGSILSI